MSEYAIKKNRNDWTWPVDFDFEEPAEFELALFFAGGGIATSIVPFLPDISCLETDGKNKCAN